MASPTLALALATPCSGATRQQATLPRSLPWARTGLRLRPLVPGALRSPSAEAQGPWRSCQAQQGTSTGTGIRAGSSGGGAPLALAVAVGVAPAGEEEEEGQAEALSAAEKAAILGSEELFREHWARAPRRICIFVEPSPFSYVCGYKNRFQNFIRNLTEGGDEVCVITTSKDCPTEFHGAKVYPALSFPFFYYPELPVALGFSPRILKIVRDFNPDIIHATSPGIMCWGAAAIGLILSKAMVFSYHTHVPKYIPVYPYTINLFVPLFWRLFGWLHNAGHVTLTTSSMLAGELTKEGAAAGGEAHVWPKGIDAEIFNPRFRSQDMRTTLAGGEPEKPVLVHVGRLGIEKNLSLLRPLLDQLPGVRLAFVGDGPFRAELEALFAGTPTVFTGMLSGEALSRAYASGDVFLMPSETETLGFVVLEAMASGLPVVAVRAGGIPDIVSEDGVTGFLFEPGNVDEAVAKVKLLLESPALRARMAEAGRRDVSRFEWAAATQEVRQKEYPLAAWRHTQRLRDSWLRWLPWWTKKAEWDTVFGGEQAA